jgi:hypothetical protein
VWFPPSPGAGMYSNLRRYLEDKKLFEEFAGMDPDAIMIALCEEGFRMHAPTKCNDICHNCITAQWIRKKTGRPVSCGTTSFIFEDEWTILRYLPENISHFTQRIFTGKYPRLYV